MIRMYRRDAQLLLMTLLYLKSQGADLTALMRFVEQQVNENSKPWAEVFWALRNEGDLYGISLDELIDQLTATVRDSRNGVKGDANLVDAIVDTLQLPYSRNTLSGKLLHDLRRAVLVPSEAAGLAERLRNKEMRCASCGKTFFRGELAIAISDGGMMFYCHQCTRPEYVACDHNKCEEPVAFSKVYSRKHPSKDIDCGDHKPQEVVPGPGDGAALAPNIQVELDRQRRIVNRFRQAAQRLAPQPDALGNPFQADQGDVAAPAPWFERDDDLEDDD